MLLCFVFCVFCVFVCFVCLCVLCVFCFLFCVLSVLCFVFCVLCVLCVLFFVLFVFSTMCAGQRVLFASKVSPDLLEVQQELAPDARIVGQTRQRATYTNGQWKKISTENISPNDE